MSVKRAEITEFPKICPAVIVGVTDHNRILMSKYAGRTYKKICAFSRIFGDRGDCRTDCGAGSDGRSRVLKVKTSGIIKVSRGRLAIRFLWDFIAILTGMMQSHLTERNWRWQNGLKGKTFL